MWFEYHYLNLLSLGKVSSINAVNVYLVVLRYTFRLDCKIITGVQALKVHCRGGGLKYLVL